jgi:hypothetical protein
MTTRRTIPLGATATLCTLAAVLASAPGVDAKRARAAASCAPVSNIEAIIDDSGSMSFTDPNRLRVAALNLLIETPGNEKITFGAVEFGGAFQSGEVSADTVFPPELIGSNAKSMESSLDQAIQANNGLTDYNQAFAKAKADDPGAKAWIFLTDGGHDVGEYENGHRGGPPTYVISFGGGIAPEDGQRLQQIANDNGGVYFPQTDSSNLQAVVNQIGTKLTCQTVPTTFRDAFSKPGQSKIHSVPLSGNVKSAQLTLSWASPLDSFTFSNLKIVSKGKTVAVSSRKFKVTTRHGTTFLVAKLSQLVRGTLRFTVRANTVSSGAAKVNLTTQVTQGG